VAEKLPDQIAAERNATIKQAMKSIAQERIGAINQMAATLSAERKAVIDAFTAEEEDIRGLLTDLRQTLETGNQFVGSLNTLATQFKSANSSEPAKPFDIRDYQTTLVELSHSAQELTKLAAMLDRISDKVVANQLIPKVENALDTAESKGEELIDHTMRQMVLLILIGLIGYIIAKLLIEYISTKMKAHTK
jgi:DNA replication initiation complex subunit (GINS family)